MTTPTNTRHILPTDPLLSRGMPHAPLAGGYYELLTDRWWSCDEQGRPLIYRRSVQCNGNESIARRVQEQLYPWGQTLFYNWVWVPIDPTDYCQHGRWA